ncbi:MAG TPA: winged helix DNA-binding protein [Candidatus Microbacterium pullistercoris]|nr:winged helix DNA-binding protein [Candidatus Microbacterium pullistercoris]
MYRGAASITHLADALGIGSSNISKLVARLERHGLVMHVVDLADKRALVVTLTRDGRAVAQRLLDAVQAQQTSFLSDWSPDDGAELERLVVKLARAMDALPQHPLSTIAGVDLGVPSPGTRSA